MGPVSKAALIKHQEAVVEFHGAVLEEFRWLRGKINELVGRGALDKETADEWREATEKRLTELENRARSGPVGPDAAGR